MKLLLVLTSVVTLACTLPIDDPNDDVELVPPSVVQTGSSDRGAQGGGAPIFIIRTLGDNGGPLGSSGFLPFFEAILGGGRDRSGVDTEEVEVIPSFPPVRELDINLDEEDLLTPFFGGADDTDDDGRCGLFCNIFRAVGTQLKSIEEKLKETLDEIPINKKGQCEPKTTYEEKVLDDGTVVKIKKTSCSDSSDDGNSYYGYHSTQVTSVKDEDKDDTDDEKPEKAEEEAATRDYPVEEDDYDSLENDVVRPIKLIKQDDLRKKRQANDPFNQQTEDISYFNQISQSPFNQAPVRVVQQPVYYSPAYPSLVRTAVAQPASVKPITLEGDTRVNDLLLENARRGGLVRIEPDSEFIDEDTATLSH